MSEVLQPPAPAERKPVQDFPVRDYMRAAEHLRRPFTPAAVKFKVQATWGPEGEQANAALIVAYIDARLVIERLNLVCPQLWADEYEATAGGLMWCHLTVDGLTRRDVGEGRGKALVSDALKRAAVHFGVGVSLYAIPKIVLKAADKHVTMKQGKLALTPNGETRCRNIYEAWLDLAGTQAFGEPLDHGDVDDAAGDPDPHEEPAEAAAPATEGVEAEIPADRDGLE